MGRTIFISACQIVCYVGLSRGVRCSSTSDEPRYTSTARLNRDIFTSEKTPTSCALAPRCSSEVQLGVRCCSPAIVHPPVQLSLIPAREAAPTHPRVQANPRSSPFEVTLHSIGLQRSLPANQQQRSSRQPSCWIKSAEQAASLLNQTRAYDLGWPATAWLAQRSLGCRHELPGRPAGRIQPQLLRVDLGRSARSDWAA